MQLVLGTVQFGMDYGVQGGIKPSEERVSEMLSLALAEKVNRFDTASSYGSSEEVLGRYRKSNPNKAKEMHIISKLPPKALVDEPQRNWKDIILRNISRSIRRLNVSELDAFLFHNAEYIFDETAIRALQCVCGENMAQKIGVSVYTPKEAMKALEYDEIKVIQIPYNIFDQRLDKCGFFEKAEKKKVEIYARSSMLQGLLLMDPDRLPERMEFARKYLRRFLNICIEYQLSPLEAAIGYVGEHSGIDYVVFGVDNKVQLLEYLAMRDEKLTEDVKKTFQKEFEEVEEKLVNPVLWEC
ncbi:MAG: aldo/keto reductase [Dorea sp.]|nr:aldo/keto reductase [Dorea sp.]